MESTEKRVVGFLEKSISQLQLLLVQNTGKVDGLLQRTQEVIRILDQHTPSLESPIAKKLT